MSTEAAFPGCLPDDAQLARKIFGDEILATEVSTLGRWLLGQIRFGPCAAAPVACQACGVHCTWEGERHRGRALLLQGVFLLTTLMLLSCFAQETVLP